MSASHKLLLKSIPSTTLDFNGRLFLVERWLVYPEGCSLSIGTILRVPSDEGLSELEISTRDNALPSKIRRPERRFASFKLASAALLRLHDPVSF